MQKLLREMLLMALLCLPLATMAQGFNYTCDFENDADIAAWSYANGENTNKWCIDTATHNGAGSKALYISNDNGVSHHYFENSITNVFAYHTLTLSMGNYEYSYDWQCYGEYSWGTAYDYMRVALVPDAVSLEAGVNPGIVGTALPEGWIALDGGSALCESDSWSTKTGSVIVPTTGDYKIVCFWHNDGGGGIQPPAAIDNFSLELPSCPTPINLIARNIVGDSVQLSWQETGSATVWSVECVPEGQEPNTGAGITATATSPVIVIHGLDYNTNYDVYVKSNCPDNEYSNYATATFRSACGTIELPYNESFETEITNQFPDCWHLLNGDCMIVENGYSDYYTYTTDGVKSLKVSNNFIVATPYIPLDGASIALDFIWKSSGSDAGSLQICFTTDLSNLANMTVIKTINATNTDINVYDADFSSVLTEGVGNGYIVFKQVTSNPYSQFYPCYLDGVFIRQLSDCRRPALVTADNVTYESATLNWPSVDAATGYEIAYGLINNPDTSANSHVSNIPVNYATIDNLMAESDYYFWVRSLCDDEYSEWREGGSFRTQIACAPLENIQVTNISTHGAALNWSFNDLIGIPASAVNVEIRARGTEAYTSYTTSNRYYIFSDLQPATTYEYRLRTICNTDTASAITGTFITTPCGHMIAGGNSTSAYLPIYTSSYYSYSQSLYKAEELIGLDTIHGFAMRFFSGEGLSRTLDIYLGNVNRNELLTGDPVRLDSLTKVCDSKTVTFNNGWCSIEFDTIFVRHNDSNLVIAIYDKSGLYNSSNTIAYIHEGGNSLYQTSYDPIDLNTTIHTATLRGIPDIIFCTPCPENVCGAPILALGEITAHEANLVWAANDADNRWVVEYKQTANSEWTIASTVNATNYTLTNLQPGTFYNARVGSLCGNDTLYSYIDFLTECAAVSAPYIENFNAGILNPCLTLGNDVNPNALPHLYSNSLEMGYNVGAYVIFPEIVNEINTLRMEYSIKASNVNSQIEVLVGTDINDWSTFVPFDTAANVETFKLERQMTYFNAYEGEGHYIALKSLSPNIYLDDITIETIPDCAMPMNLSISNITFESADLTWIGNNGTSDGWIITLRNIATNELFDDASAECSYSFTELLPDTEYEVMVYNLCGEDSIEALRPIHFKTMCGTIVLPFVESFEGKPSGEAPSCWTVANGYIQVQEMESYTTDGIKLLCIDNNGVLVSPLVPLAGNSIVVDFLLKRGSEDAGKIVVGFTTDATNLTNIEIVDTLELNNGDCTPFSLNFSNINATEQGFIVWKQIDINSYSYMNTSMYLDKIYIREYSNCPRVENAYVDHISYDQAIVHWDVAEGVTDYEVIYGTVNDFNSSDNISMMAEDADSLTIVELDGNTTYYVWVRSLCSNGSNSDWRAAQPFTTQISCAQIAEATVNNVATDGIALSWKFNTTIGAPATEVELGWKTDEEESYSTIIVSGNYHILSNLQPATAYQIRLRTICNEDTATAYELRTSTLACGITLGEATSKNNLIPSNGGYRYSYTQMLYPASDLIGLDTIKTIAFNWATGTEVSRTWDIYMGHTERNQLSNNSYMPSDSLTLVGSAIVFHSTPGWCSIQLTTPFVYNSDSNLVIAVDDNTGSQSFGYKEFYVHNGSSIEVHVDDNNLLPSNPPTFNELNKVPDIVFAQPCQEDACTAPLLTMGNITSTSIQLVWRSGNVNDSWQVEYKLANGTDWTIAQTNFTDTIITINNLNPGTYYDFRVATNCTEGTLYSYIEGFTECAAITAPLSESFDNSEVNPCWTLDNLNPGYYKPSISEHHLFMGGDLGGYVILPEFTNDISTLHMLYRFNAYSAGAEVIVAVGSDASDSSTFVAVDTAIVTNPDNFELHECNFSNYTGHGHIIAFYCTSGRIFLDDIVVEEIPQCSMPTNLTISDITDNSAKISWTSDSPMTTAWLIDYNIVGDPNIQHRSVIASENSYIMTELAPNTNYVVMVSNACVNDTLAALAPVTFRTECSAIKLPYFENFENIAINTYHDCWSSTNAHSYTSNFTTEYAPVVVNVGAGHGKALKFCDTVNMITPFINEAANLITINFDALSEYPGHTGDLVIGFSATPTDANMTVVDTVRLESFYWENFEISFSGIGRSDMGYIVFKNINNRHDVDGDYAAYYNGYIDNLSIYVDYGCSNVSNITINQVTENSAAITFTDTTNNGNYTIGYSTVNDCNNINDSINVTATTNALMGLQPATTYYVWVRNNCSNGVSPWVAAHPFTTLCNPINDIPYSENFDSYTVDVMNSQRAPSNYPLHAMPNCWSFINMSETSNSYPQAFLTTKEDYADSANCLFMKSSDETPLYAILPSFTTHVSSLQISFTYRNEGISAANGTLALGVMTDASDASTFTVVKEYPQTDNLTNVSHNFAIDGLNANTNYTIAFRYTGGTYDNSYLSIDNVLVEQASDCIVPENIQLTDISQTTATLTWLGIASSYNVQYRQSTATEWTSTIANGNSITLTGLTAQTNYLVRVQSICTGNSTSDWSSNFNFNTTCGAVAIPYSEDFSSYTADIARGTSAPDSYPNHTMPTCWSFPILESSPKAFLSRHSNYAESNNCLLLISNDLKDVYAVLPEMAVPVDSLQISFTYCNEGTSSSNSPLVLGVMTDPNDTTTFQAMETFAISSSITNAEYSFSIRTDLVAGTTYYIAFRYGHNGYNYALGIDNVVVDYAPTCPKPSSLSVDSLSHNMAEISWISNASNFEVNYKTEADTDWTVTNVSTTSATLNNLSASTTYEARVRAICSVGDTSEWSTSITFTTECATYDLPFSEDFTVSGSNINNLKCWEKYRGLLSDILAGTDELEPTTSGWNSYNSDRYPINSDGGYNAFINIYGSSAKYWLVSPTINLTSNAELIFDLARRDRDNDSEPSTDDQFVVLASTDDGATWTTLQTWSGNDYDNIAFHTATADSINISLAQFANQSIRIAFYGESSEYNTDRYIHIDNIEVLAVAPVCDVPTDLVANDITATSVNLSWTATATAYDVEYRVQDATDWTTTNVTETNLALTELQPSTNYEWRVRSICGENITSDWATNTFTTEEEPICNPVTNVSANDITEISAMITWTATEGQTAWEIVYGEANFNHTTAQATAVNATEYEITNLTANTTYDVYVRAVCGENFYSDWSEKVTFQTLESEPEGIDGVDGQFNFNIYPNPTSNSTTISLNGVEGKVSISVVDMNGREVTNETIECGNDCEKRIDVAGLAQGTYFVRVIGDSINCVRKLIVR